MKEELHRYITINYGPVEAVKALSGGCINKACRIDLKDGRTFFLKWNRKKTYPEMFEKEAKGLQLLGTQETIQVPEVIETINAGEYSALLLEYLPLGYESKEYWAKLGAGLAQLHRNTNVAFGLSYDNYIGSLEQKNTFNSDWGDFFWDSRIFPLAQEIAKQGIASNDFIAKVEKLELTFKKLCNTDELPSLVHGDLWSGNVMATLNDLPAVFDPAVYYGNREIEMAFTKLFGGFDAIFYEEYQREFPLLPGFKEREDMYQLYPLLVHSLLFGRSYVNSVLSILNRYS